MAKKFEIELVNFFIFNPLLSPKEGEVSSRAYNKNTSLSLFFN